MGNKEFSLGHDVFAVSIRQLSGDVVWATGCESGVQGETADMIWENPQNETA